MRPRRRPARRARRSSAGSRGGWSSARAPWAAAASSATPAAAQMQSVMNLKIKFRESFRPFAPSVLRERVHEYFELRPGEDSPYMLLVAPVRERSGIAVDGQADGSQGIDKLQGMPLGRPGRSRTSTTRPACRRSTRERHGALLPAAEGVRGEDRLPGDHQHQLQRPRRADRLHAGGRLPLLHGHQHGRAGAGATSCC